MPPTSRTLRLGTGLDYHLLEWGGDDPALEHTVILVHGFLDLAWGWEEVVEAGLAGRFHLVAPDMRGHGDSGHLGAGGYYHFPDYLADLHEVVQAVGRRRVSLVGHSMGGSITSYYAGTYPARIARLALLEGLGPPEMGDMGPERVASWIEAWRKIREKPARTYATVAEAAAQLRKHDPKLSPALSERLAAHGTRPAPDGRLQFKHDPLHATPGPFGFRVDVAMRFWARVTCPVLLVEGSESFFRLDPADAARRRGAFQHAETQTLLGAGHMMMRHQPRELGAMLAAFLGMAP
jgi:pimeloyl-ACP methyl ester carboxylesterase